MQREKITDLKKLLEAVNKTPKLWTSVAQPTNVKWGARMLANTVSHRPQQLLKNQIVDYRYQYKELNSAFDNLKRLRFFIYIEFQSQSGFLPKNFWRGIEQLQDANIRDLLAR